MKKESTKKRAFLMVLMMVIGLLSPIGTSVQTVQAETKGASIRTVMAEPFSWEVNNFVEIHLKDVKEDAVYTATTSDNSIAEYCCYHKNGHFVKLFVKKPEKFSVTVKENYNGNITNIGTQTIEPFQYIGGTELKRSKIIMELGTNSALENVGTLSEDAKVTVKDTSIVKVKKSSGKTILTAKKVGKTTLTVKYSSEYSGEKQTQSLEVEVRKKSSSERNKKARNLAAKVDKYCKTSITTKNAEKILKGIADLKIKSEDDFRIDFSEKTTEYGYIKETGKLVPIKVKRNMTLMIPSKYTYEDLKYVQNQCKFALQLDLNTYGVSLEVVAIKKITDNSITLQLEHPITSKEILAMDGKEKKFPIIVEYEGKYDIWDLTAKVKEGDTEITGKFKITQNDPAFQKGETYKVYVYNHTNFTTQKLTKTYE